jgi:tetraacyldisaccharide 4'-kinase
VTGPVIDRRGPARRWLDAFWSREGGEAGWRARLAAATAPCNRALMRRRRRGRGTPPAHPLIVSIGNLLSGGTGKTPVIIDLARTLGGRGIPGVVLTRGYGSRLRGPLVVEPGTAAAGDEARLAAGSLPDGWSVVQARDRRRGLAFAAERLPAPGVVILEDGFQTAGVPRHLDVLILDRWRLAGGVLSPRAGPLLPWGPYREGPEAAAEAAIWLVEGELPDAVRSPAGGPRDVLGFTRRTDLPAGWGTAAGATGLVSGLARPGGFEAACRRLLGGEPAVTVRFADHHRYTAADTAWLAAEGRRRGVDGWLTTGKDLSKLRALAGEDLPVAAVRLGILWGSGGSLADVVVRGLGT